jgi:hypothetical protein
MLASAVVDAILNASQTIGHEKPYAFALIQGQQCGYLGYAIATHSALVNTVNSYLGKGYRYNGMLHLNDGEAIKSWLKWANPDDGWYYFDFENQAAMNDFLLGFHGDDDSLRSGCIAELKKVSLEHPTASITLGVTYGEDPEDFRRSVVDIYGQRGHNNFLDEFSMMQRLGADIKRA